MSLSSSPEGKVRLKATTSARDRLKKDCQLIISPHHPCWSQENGYPSFVSGSFVQRSACDVAVDYDKCNSILGADVKMIGQQIRLSLSACKVTLPLIPSF